MPRRGEDAAANDLTSGLPSQVNHPLLGGGDQVSFATATAAASSSPQVPLTPPAIAATSGTPTTSALPSSPQQQDGLKNDYASEIFPSVNGKNKKLGA